MARREPGRPVRPCVLVLASTFPSSDDDPVPAFVRDQVRALTGEFPDLDVCVVAPHDRRSRTRSLTHHATFDEVRFHYALPRSAEVLAGRGIMPALRGNPWLYPVVPLLFLGELVAVLRETRRRRPAVLYAHWFTPQAVVASWVSRLTGVPFVFTTHASDVDVWRRVPFAGALVVRPTLRRARAASAVSTRTLQRLRHFDPAGRVGPPVHVIPMGTDLPDRPRDPAARAAARTALAVDGDELVLLFVGRLVEKKGVQHLLEALRVASDDLGPWRLVVAGDGPLRDDLVARVEHLGLSDRVVFTGYVSGERKASCFRAADVLVVPSVVASDGDVEGLPVTLIEGLSYGLPCVATRQSGADDVLDDGRTGLLVDERDHDGLAAALVRVAHLDDEQREALGRRAVELSRAFSWDHLARRHHDALLAPFVATAQAAA
ncbi:glycosyltransferase [Cellulomonas sp. S1-8]|uniref:glycosyltransferase n=1 Tax=Cellulomonas sp. S1-8 TaxID=2904790 RepID=UPI002242DE3B|nr:glycosyltransferase [Cellulomonas sp. S1-8]UZN01913.1 glycosyltransferase [Cellulomonas sp. S1-8]